MQFRPSELQSMKRFSRWACFYSIVKPTLHLSFDSEDNIIFLLAESIYACFLVFGGFSIQIVQNGGTASEKSLRL